MISTIASLVASTTLNAADQPPAIDLNATTTTNYLYTTIDLGQNRSGADQNDTYSPVIPTYIRNTSIVFCVIIMCLGVIGNIMVPIVIFKSKDMRNSTNIFLVNLSVADLMVLLVCTPTVLVEVNSQPDTWVLGEKMCKAVPFVEMTVAHASVLTILAISFERYYAICKPLKAGYVCTKTRASLICLLAWFFAAVFTSPILSISEFRHSEYYDGTSVPTCRARASTFWPSLYFIMTIVVFFMIPLILLLIIYAIIAKNLISDAAKIVLNKHIDSYNIRARRQVVLMLGTVVLSFFLCLIPFKVFTFWIIITPVEKIAEIGIEKYYNILYFCRIMVYLNSAINPILYNLMSSKFREGFLIWSKNRRFHFRRSRNGTFSTTVTSYRSSTFRSQGSFRGRPQAVVLKNDSPDSNRSSDSRTKIFTKDSPIFRPDKLDRTKGLTRSQNDVKHDEILDTNHFERTRLDSVEIEHLNSIGNRSNHPIKYHECQAFNLDLSDKELDDFSYDLVKSKTDFDPDVVDFEIIDSNVNNTSCNSNVLLAGADNEINKCRIENNVSKTNSTDAESFV